MESWWHVIKNETSVVTMSIKYGQPINIKIASGWVTPQNENHLSLRML